MSEKEVLWPGVKESSILKPRNSSSNQLLYSVYPDLMSVII